MRAQSWETFQASASVQHDHSSTQRHIFNNTSSSCPLDDPIEYSESSHQTPSIHTTETTFHRVTHSTATFQQPRRREHEEKEEENPTSRSSEWNVEVVSNYFLPVSSSPASVVLAIQLLHSNRPGEEENPTSRSSEWNVDVLSNSFFLLFPLSTCYYMPKRLATLFL